jgi:SAM-dependent methyltransferase
MSDMWNAAAGGWERNAEVIDAHLAAATEVLLQAAGVGEAAAVLDVASGPGGAGVAAAARVGPAGSVVLADVAPAMVEAAARRTETMANVRATVCDELAIDAPDASFDAVICRHGLMFVAEPADAVREAMRVLRRGGRYAAMTWDARAANPWLGLILDAVGEQFGVPFPPPGISGPFSLEEPEQLAQALRAGGLEDVEVTRHAAPMTLPSLVAWWERVPELAGPVAQALAGMEPGVRDAICRRALAAGETAAQIVDDGVRFDGSVLIGSGRVP